MCPPEFSLGAQCRLGADFGCDVNGQHSGPGLHFAITAGNHGTGWPGQSGNPAGRINGQTLAESDLTRRIRFI